MLINIQLLRFSAAAMVVLHHEAAHVRASGHDLGVVFGFGESAGFAGVDIFFVISGFIMAWTTMCDSGPRDALEFAKRRVARIYSGYWPFYLLALAMFALLGGGYMAGKHLVPSFFLWPTELQHLLIPVSWTLVFEMVFYALFAVMIAIGGTRRDALIWLTAIVMLAWALWSHFGRQAYDPGRLEYMNVYEQYLAFPFMLEFLAGAMLAPWLRRRPPLPGGFLLAAGSALLLAGGWISDTRFDGKLIEGYYVIWRVLVFGTASVLLVAGVALLEQRRHTVAPKFCVLAGGASYAIYLSHTLMLDVTQRLGLNSALSQVKTGVAQATFIGVAILIVLYSMAHHQWIEKPLHRAFRRWLKV